MARRHHMSPEHPYRIAVIPTRNRHDMMLDLLWDCRDQFDHIIVVDNFSDPMLDRRWLQRSGWMDDLYSAHVSFIHNHMDPPNISFFWNQGIQRADDIIRGKTQRWDIAVLNSDVRIPKHWASAMSVAMRSTSAVLAYPYQFGDAMPANDFGVIALHTKAEPVPLTHRITGYAYMLRGEAGLRIDTSMRWWYSDDDLDWSARLRGGAALVAGLGVEHRDPNGSTNAREALQIQAGHDRQTFLNKWGRTPH